MAIGKSNFADNDGSLPSIEIRHLAHTEVPKLFDALSSAGFINEVATIWDERVKADVPISQIPNPAARVASHDLDCFHVVVSGVNYEGESIPDLGVFVFQDAIEINYRMGSGWTPRRVTAFLHLLEDLRRQTISGEGRPADCEAPPFPETFIHCFRCCVANRE